MSSEMLQKENFFSLSRIGPKVYVKAMETPKQIYERFYAILKKHENSYGSGFNKFLHLETGLTTGFISLVLSGQKKPSQEAQMKICEAIGFNYASLLNGNPLSKIGRQGDLVAELRAENARLQAALDDALKELGYVKKAWGYAEQLIAMLKQHVRNLGGVLPEDVLDEKNGDNKRVVE